MIYEHEGQMYYEEGQMYQYEDEDEFVDAEEDAADDGITVTVPDLNVSPQPTYHMTHSPQATNQGEPVSETTNQSEAVLETTNQSEAISKTTNQSEAVLETTNQNEPVLETTNQSEAISETTNQNDAVSVTTNQIEGEPNLTIQSKTTIEPDSVQEAISEKATQDEGSEPANQNEAITEIAIHSKSEMSEMPEVSTQASVPDNLLLADSINTVASQQHVSVEHSNEETVEKTEQTTMTIDENTNVPPDGASITETTEPPSEQLAQLSTSVDEVHQGATEKKESDAAVGD